MQDNIHVKPITQWKSLPVTQQLQFTVSIFNLDFFFLNFINGVTPVIGASYTKLMNLFRIPPQILFRFICMHWSQVLVGTTEFRWNHCSHYFAQKDVTICLRSHCFSWTVFNSENGLKPTPFEQRTRLAHILILCEDFWLGRNGNRGIGQNVNCQLRNYIIFLLIAEISRQVWKWAETKTACLRFAHIFAYVAFEEIYFVRAGIHSIFHYSKAFPPYTEYSTAK